MSDDREISIAEVLLGIGLTLAGAEVLARLVRDPDAQPGMDADELAEELLDDGPQWPMSLYEAQGFCNRLLADIWSGLDPEEQTKTLEELDEGKADLLRDLLAGTAAFDAEGAPEWYAAPCQDCGEDTSPREGPWEFFMVHDEVWAAAGADDGFLCVGCLEWRLGRTLDHRDFSDAPCNQWVVRDSERLRSRKTP